MKVVRVSAIFLILMVVGVRQGTPLLSDIWDALKFGYSVTSKLFEGGSAYDLITDDTGEKLDSIYAKVKDIMKDQRELSNRLESNVQIMMDNLAKDLKNDGEFQRLRDRITLDYIGRIRNAFKSLHDAADRKYRDETVFALAKQLTSYAPHEINDNLGNIAQVISEGGSSYFTSFIDVLLTHTELQTANRCGKGSSLQQEVYHLYELLASTERLAFTTLSYAYTIRSKHSKVNFTNEIRGAQTDMEDRTRQYMRIIKKAMAKVSTEIHQCEPSEYIRNENFIELERLNQLVVMPEEETSATIGCAGECRWFNASQSPQFAKDVKGQIGLGQNCIKCESAGHTSICYPEGIDSRRRYFGVRTNLEDHAADSVLGSMNQCYEKTGGVYPVPEYDSHVSGLNKCDVCICTCVNHEVERKWRHSLSLKAEEADISKNMVVTGIRFYKTKTPYSGQVIYPQIKVGKLLPGSEVSKAVWKQPEIDSGYAPLVNGGRDYVVIGQQADQVNIVNLDDAYVQANHVVTGVKFVVGEDRWRVKRPWYLVHDYVDSGKSVGLFVRMTRCNFTSAQLFPDSTKYGHPDYDISLTSSSPSREELWLENLDVPIKATKVKPITKNRQYIRFSMSDTVKDFGQSTVPFFDIQPVETSPPAPLSGVGLFVKGETGFGGFLAFKIMTLNMTNVIDTGVPEQEIELSDLVPSTGGIILPESVRPKP